MPLSASAKQFENSSNTVPVYISTTPGAGISLGGVFRRLHSESSDLNTSIKFDQYKTPVLLRVEKSGFIPFEYYITTGDINSAGFIQINKPLRASLTRSRPVIGLNSLGLVLLGLFLIIGGYLFFRVVDTNKFNKLSLSRMSFKKFNKTSQARYSIINNTETSTSKRLDRTAQVDNQLDHMAAKFDNYQIVKKIGSGGVSEIYLAINADEKYVALKVMTKFLDDEDMVQKFINEGWIISQINRQFPEAPIIQVFDFRRENGSPKGKPYIAMELVNGVTLNQFVLESNPSIQTLDLITLRVLDAIQAVHALGILHRDLAPDNILVFESESGLDVRLIDFGVVRHELTWLKSLSYGSTYGKPEYMSPEQFEGAEYLDYRSDYYSLGVVLFSVFNGGPPFVDKNIFKVGDMHKNDQIPPLPTDTPTRYADLIHHLMQKDPNLRPSSIDQIRSYLT